jgi:hypothetical protein
MKRGSRLRFVAAPVAMKRRIGHIVLVERRAWLNSSHFLEHVIPSCTRFAF